ncbi:MAG: discoidin domain-containing protein, partial [Terriglobales bacterium]
MHAKTGWGFFSVAVAILFASALVAPAHAQAGRPARRLITEQVDESQLITLAGNWRPEASAENDLGPAADSMPMEHMLLQLRRTPEQEQALAELIEQLHNPDSPNFHQWLTAQEFGERFGPAPEDLQTITAWLESHGFAVHVVYPSGMLIDFSGTAGQVRQAFHAPIHHLEVNGVKHIANMGEPQIPAALAGAVAGVVSLHDFRPHATYKPRADYTFTSGGSTVQAVAPADLATIYNLNPLFSAGISGQNQTVVVIEDTDVFTTADWTTFRSTFGLSSFSGSFAQVHPAPTGGGNNCSDPGVNGDDIEAILDAEWASAAAPSAAIQLASCANTSSFGGLIAFQNLINGSSPPAIISISYGECEALNGASANAAYNSAYQQAVTEGVSVFVSSGDEGAASCDAGGSKATHGIGVSAFASTPYNVAVGGSDYGDSFADTNSSYWNSSNTASFGSAKSYIPEIPWNDSCASVLLATFVSGSGITYGSSGFCNSTTGQQFLTTGSGSGGPSGCATGTPSTGGVVSGTCAGYAKPSWQSVFGNPGDGVRDLPDVSLFAANGVWGHFFVFCDSDTANGGTACTGAPSGWSGAGGTSFSTPILAGIQALVNQKVGARQGNPNPVYYSLAATEYGASGSGACNSTLGNGVASSCIFYDVTQGDMDVNCTGSHNCYRPSGTNGVLSTSNGAYSPAYGTTPGWDFATGIGTINAANLVNNWPNSAPNFSLSANPTSVTLTQGGPGGPSTITVNPQNGFSGGVGLSASGLPTGVTASFNPTSTTTTSTLTLSANGAATTGSVNVTIAGTSGSLNNSTQISLTVLAQTWNISGTISGAGGSGAAVALSGTASASTTADASGNYSFGGLAAGPYTVTPSKAGYTFSPASQPTTISNANITALNFSTLYSIAGTIGGAGGSGATVALSGTASASTTADASGNYSFSGLANGSYTVTPSLAGDIFSPASQPVTVSGANVPGVNFTAFSSVARTLWSVLFVDSQETICGNGVGANAFDGNPNTMWHTQFCPSSAPMPHEIQINLRASYQLTAFQYLPRQDGSACGWIRQYEFYVSADGVNWGTPAATGTFNYGSLSTKCPGPGASMPSALQIVFPPATGHYVRLRALSELNGNPWTSAAEINVLGALVAGQSTALTSVSLNPAIVVGGGSSTGTVTLSTPAPAGGALVSLSSSNTAVATVPASVTVPANAISANFTITTTAVGTVTQLNIAGSYSGNAQASFTVNPGSLIPQSGWSLVSVDSQETICGNGVGANAFDGNPSTMWHTQFCPSAAPMPHQISINLGASYTLTAFQYLPRQDGSACGWIKNYAFYVSSDGVNWGTAVATGTFNYGNLSTNCPGPGAGVPQALQIAFPQTTGQYIRLVALDELHGNPWTSAAELNVLGTVSGSAPPPTLAQVTVNPAIVVGGTSAQGTVSLSGPAPAAGAVVSLSSSDP